MSYPAARSRSTNGESSFSAYRRFFPTQAKHLAPSCRAARSRAGPDVGYHRDLSERILLDRARSARNSALFALYTIEATSRLTGERSREQILHSVACRLFAPAMLPSASLRLFAPLP